MQHSSTLLASALADLETSGPASKLFFTRDVQPVVLEACRRHNISFDEYAARLGTTRTALVLMLKGIDPIPYRMRDSLRDFVDAARQGRAATAA
ncbi:hypothetical protein [Ferrovibrio terrae]|uniref:hypothetical protein n=1 Tax=Ferrovibrio terrae TaxID=2594003 RepID=UPI0031379AE6